jgi:hypothetical protein
VVRAPRLPSRTLTRMRRTTQIGRRKLPTRLSCPTTRPGGEKKHSCGGVKRRHLMRNHGYHPRNSRAVDRTVFTVLPAVCHDAQASLLPCEQKMPAAARRPHLRLRHDLCSTYRVTMCQQTTPHTTHDTHKGRGTIQEKERAGRRRRRPPDRRHVSLEGCAARSPQAHALDAPAASPERAPPAERGDNPRFCRVGLLPDLSPLGSAADPEGTARGTDIRQVPRMRACAVGGNTHLGGGRWQGGRTSRREDL